MNPTPVSLRNTTLTWSRWEEADFLQVAQTARNAAINLLPICDVHTLIKKKRKAISSSTFGGGSLPTYHGGFSAPSISPSLQTASAESLFIIHVYHHTMSTVCYQFHGWTGSNLELLHETPALPSTLKRIPLSLTRPTTLMCARREERPRAHSDCNCKNAHTPNVHIQTHTSVLGSATVRSPFEFRAPASHTLPLTLHRGGRRNESITAVIANLLRWRIITSRWLPCLLKTRV